METLINNKKQKETHSAVYTELQDVHLEVVAGGFALPPAVSPCYGPDPQCAFNYDGSQKN